MGLLYLYRLASLKIFLRNSGLLRDPAHRLTVRMLTVLRCSVAMNETSAV